MTTKMIQIEIITGVTYLPDESSAEKLQFLWSYKIIINNKSDEIVQLLNRFWRITDMSGKVEEIRGPGVVGLQPIIKPEKSFVYSSFCQLNTPQGTMEGYYEMQNLDEIKFRVEVPKFILSTPSAVSSSFRSKLH